MAISFANIGEVRYVVRVAGKEDVRKHLGKLGFVPGSQVQVVSKMGENVIINVKNTRVAVSKELARKIHV
jgi:ferrous iron transport protein A